MKKIIFSFFIATLYIILSYGVCCSVDDAPYIPAYNSLIENLGNDIIDVLEGDPYQENPKVIYAINGKTGAENGFDVQYHADQSILFDTSESYAYCISAGRGTGGDRTSDKYALTNCVIIGPKGIYYTINEQGTRYRSVNFRGLG